MFEFSVACKYLIPRRRQLSVSIISLVSILVISLVVWLIIVFFSVTDGLEKNWIQKLTALTAPIRVTPTPAYYQSYYYQVDSISENSDYLLKTIEEKWQSHSTDPYEADYDQQLPATWPAADLDREGKVKDLVKLAYQAIEQVKGVKKIEANSFEITTSHLDLFLKRKSPLLSSSHLYSTTVFSSLSYAAYLGNFTNQSQLSKTLLPLSAQDFNNFLIGLEWKNHLDEQEKEKILSPHVINPRLQEFFKALQITHLKTAALGVVIPFQFLPKQARFDCWMILKNNKIAQIILVSSAAEEKAFLSQFSGQPKNMEKGKLIIEEQQLFWQKDSSSAMLLHKTVPLLYFSDPQGFEANLVQQSLVQAERVGDLLFEVQIPIQGKFLKGRLPFKNVEIAGFKQLKTEQQKFWLDPLDLAISLPSNKELGDGILLPKSFKDAGILLGDTGSLSYYSPTATTIQEQLIPVYVAGFYDPGIIPIGGKFILANPNVVSLVRSSYQQEDTNSLSNGINVQFEELFKANLVKEQITSFLKAKGVDRYWQVQTYREYDFAKEIMQELQSQKYLFMLIAVVIILVACSNIISMLIILVNDKKYEIGILRAMGATSVSISVIFGVVGTAIGICGSLLGTLLAITTLANIDLLVSFLSALQGHQMFSSNLYGNKLPSELSYEALLFVLFSTILTSLLAGIVPAVKACLVRPSTTLRVSGG